MTETTEPDIVAAARALCPAEVTAATPVRGGANNRVFRVDTVAGSFALKVYPRRDDDPRDRLGAEFDALRFLESHRVNEVPKAVARDPAAGMGLYEWIDGNPIPAPTSGDIDAAGDFAQRLEILSRDASAARMPEASEACLSGAAIVSQVERRLDRLRAAAAKPDLVDFLRDEFRPRLEAAKKTAREGYRRAGWDFARDIAPARRTLSPSDFGFHNALRNRDGKIVFIDFEYFGWDDPVRLLADFLLHPGMTLDRAAKARFAGRAFAAFGNDPDFRRRLNLLYPLIGLRWGMILLNEFLPERWERRTLAGTVEERGRVEAKQLDKARRLLDRLQKPEPGLLDAR